MFFFVQQINFLCSLDLVKFLRTVYPKKYAHGFVVLCFVVVMQSFIMNSHEVFIHIHQGCFAGTGAIVRLPQCQWSKPDGHGKISQCITTTKHSKAKTVCIFLGIYCTTAENVVKWEKCRSDHLSGRSFQCHWRINQIVFPRIFEWNDSPHRHHWWRYNMETFSALQTLCEGNPTVTGGSPHKGPVMLTLTFSLFKPKHWSCWTKSRRRLQTPWRSRGVTAMRLKFIVV